MAGIGPFANIIQTARQVVFCGTFTAGGLEAEVVDGKLRILKEGRCRKFVAAVEQLSFSAAYALECGQEVTYITERAVFRLTKGGLALVEVAPGIDVERDVLALMDFTPIMEKVKKMPGDVFQ